MHSYRQTLKRCFGQHLAFQIDHRVAREWSRLTWRYRDIKAPVFLWGAGRTGSYLLYDLLSLQPEFVCARNVERSSKGLYGTAHHGGGEYDYMLANPFPPVEGFKRHVLNYYPNFHDTGKLTSDQLPTVLRSFRILVGMTARTRRLLDKAPHYTFLIDAFEEMFKDAQHIHCLRHPEAVAASYIRRMREPDATKDGGRWGSLPAGWDATRDWNIESRGTWLAVQTIRQGVANQQRLGDRCIGVRYETLVESPCEEFHRVCDFLRIAPQPSIDQLMPEQFPSYNKSLSDRDVVRPEVLDDLDQLVAELQYPPLVETLTK